MMEAFCIKAWNGWELRRVHAIHVQYMGPYIQRICLFFHTFFLRLLLVVVETEEE